MPFFTEILLQAEVLTAVRSGAISHPFRCWEVGVLVQPHAPLSVRYDSQGGAQMTFEPRFPTLRETAGTLVFGLTLYGIVLLSTHHLDGLGPLVIALVLPLLREGHKTKTPQERAEKYPLT